MKKDIQFFIDSVMKDDEEHKLIIQGWCLNVKNKKIPTITIKGNHNIKEFEVSSKLRTDVNQIYNLDSDSKCGFLVTIVVEKWSGTIRLVFSVGEESRRANFDLKKKYHLTNEFGSPFSHSYIKLKRGINYLKRNGLKNTLKRLKLEKACSNVLYEQWIDENEEDNIEKIKKNIEIFNYQPLISILMPVYNVEEKWLRKCIDSVRNQYYANWELCIADDHSSKSYVKPLLEKIEKEDSRIKVLYREENGHICEATNSALSMAEGEFIGLLDNDDELSLNALYEVVKKLNSEPQLDLIYSDEDKIDKNDRRTDPTFKPDWSPDLLMGTNYICHFGVYRKKIIDMIGGFRKGYEGAQDYDLVLRFTEKTNQIGHISKILYHWRMLETSTAVNQDSKGYAFEAGKLALQDALNRRGITGTVTHAAGLGLYNVKYDIIKTEKVSIIIPTRDGYEDLKKCVDSILLKTVYPNYEIIIADNGSQEIQTKQLFEVYEEQYADKVSVIPIDIPFNYSEINNIVARQAKGRYLLFLNNDTEVIVPEWINTMVSFAQFDRIGAVGAKLYYEDNTIQHAGVILGLGGAAGHGHHTFPKGDFGYFGRLEINCNYSAVTAACMMVKKDDFEKVNGFNEELIVAFNDVDLCLKLLELGKQNVWLHQVELYHYESKSRGYENTVEKQERFAKETEYMYQHWGRYIDNDPYYNPNLTRKTGDFSFRI